jgi:hypothetical protein
MKRWLAPIFVVGTFAQGQTSPDSFKYRVAVALEIDDATVKDRAISVIDRELRALGDVVVVDEKPNRYSWSADSIAEWASYRIRIRSGLL